MENKGVSIKQKAILLVMSIIMLIVFIFLIIVYFTDLEDGMKKILYFSTFVFKIASIIIVIKETKELEVESQKYFYPLCIITVACVVIGLILY